MLQPVGGRLEVVTLLEELARRGVQEQLQVATGEELLHLHTDVFDMPSVIIDLAGVQGGEDLADEGAEVVT